MGTRPDSSIRIGPYRRPAFKTDNKSDHTRFPSFPSRSIHHHLLHYFRPFHFSQLILCLLFIPSFRSTSVFFTLLSRLILRYFCPIFYALIRIPNLGFFTRLFIEWLFSLSNRFVLLLLCFSFLLFFLWSINLCMNLYKL